MNRRRAALWLAIVLWLLAAIAMARAGENDAWAVGDKVLVDWRGKWMPATILEVGHGKYAGTYKIHYDGWDKGWDECVIAARIKARPPQPEPPPPASVAK